MSLSINNTAISANTINIMILVFNDINLNIEKIPSHLYVKDKLLKY
jgi:hypothetical protein